MVLKQRVFNLLRKSEIIQSGKYEITFGFDFMFSFVLFCFACLDLYRFCILQFCRNLVLRSQTYKSLDDCFSFSKVVTESRFVLIVLFMRLYFKLLIAFFCNDLFLSIVFTNASIP